MWAVCPSRYDNDAPMDLRKKVVLQREQEESLRQGLNLSKPPSLPVANLYPFVSERYGGQCSLVSPGDVRLQDTRHGGSKGSLETAIRRLHQNRQHVTKTPKMERSRSADSSLFPRGTYGFNKFSRSTSCPNLTFTDKPIPPLKSRSPIKPKSYFIQRSSGHLSEHSSDSIANSYHRTYENYRSNSPSLGGAKKRKSFVPVYGERSLSPKKSYDNRTFSPTRIHDDRTSSPKRITDDRTSSPNRVYDNRTYSLPMDYGRRPPSPKRRIRSPEHTPEEYYPHSEVLLRRQLQQQTSPAYLVHVYDYYQQLVQRLREQTSPGVRLPPPMSPNSIDEDMTPDSQRKRPCRALTGKHVRQGTGASLSTLLTLRQKIQERQKAKEHDSINGFNNSGNKNAGTKKNKNQKMKPVMKSVLNKIHNC